MTWEPGGAPPAVPSDRKSTRLNSSHTEIYTLSLHDALPISAEAGRPDGQVLAAEVVGEDLLDDLGAGRGAAGGAVRSEEHTSELQSHRDLHSFPTRRSSDLRRGWSSRRPGPGRGGSR